MKGVLGHFLEIFFSKNQGISWNIGSKNHHGEPLSSMKFFQNPSYLMALRNAFIHCFYCLTRTFFIGVLS